MAVLKSAAGFYIGTLTSEGFPNSRDSGYFYTHWEAAEQLGQSDPLPLIEQEIKDELKKLVGNKHELAAKRQEFLSMALARVHMKIWPPDFHWNYSVYATPETAIRFD